jgi:nuclear cap-binding protein subunit 2
MATLYFEGAPVTVYKDRFARETEEEQQRKLAQSHTLYVGNLSFYTTEEQLHEVFSKCGDVRRIIMGLDRVKKTPCGFCFVEYYTRADAEDAMRFVNGTRVDDRIIRTDWDPGFLEGRQWGRGKHGGQVRELYRTDYDPGRGGYGVQTQEALEGAAPGGGSRKRYADYGDRPGGRGGYRGGYDAGGPRGGAGGRGGRGSGSGGKRHQPARGSGDEAEDGEGVGAAGSPGPATVAAGPESNPRFREREHDDESGSGSESDGRARRRH